MYDIMRDGAGQDGNLQYGMENNAQRREVDVQRKQRNEAIVVSIGDRAGGAASCHAVEVEVDVIYSTRAARCWFGVDVDALTCMRCLKNGAGSCKLVLDSWGFWFFGLGKSEKSSVVMMRCGKRVNWRAVEQIRIALKETIRYDSNKYLYITINNFYYLLLSSAITQVLLPST